MTDHYALPHPRDDEDGPTWRFGIEESGVVLFIFDPETHEEIAEAHLTYDESQSVLRSLSTAANEWKRHHQ
jgi:hypothetical protein